MKFFLANASLLHLVLGYALIGNFITFRNEGLHLGLGMVAALKSRSEFEIWERAGLGFGLGRV